MKKPMCKIPQPCKYTLIDSSQKEISTARDMAAIGSNLFTSHPIQSKIKNKNNKPCGKMEAKSQKSDREK